MPDHTTIIELSSTLSQFYHSDAFYRGVRGPVGSGKSTAMCCEIMRRAREQRPGTDKIRHSRWAIVRNTYGELRDTTLKTWLDWFPENIFGNINRTEFVHRITIDDLDLEVLFRALDRPDDVKKLLSLELTGAWVNETREVPKSIIDALGDRVERYPAVKDGGCTWAGVIMDTNAPDDDHWWYKFAEEKDFGDVEDVGEWAFFSQPPGVIKIDGKWRVNPDAENIDNLAPNYYQRRLPGKSEDHIKVYYGNQYGFVIDGKPVYPTYMDNIHCAQMPLEPIKGRTIYVGIDFGLTPAALFAQRTVMGQWRVIDELVTDDMGAVRFAEILGPMLRNTYADFDLEIYGDPAGDQRSQTDEMTPFQILQGRGIPAVPAPSNDVVLRREAVTGALGRMIDGAPGFLISPKCAITRKGLAGGFCYRRLQVSGQERYHDRPDKNRYSHPCEALEYAMLGAGESSMVIPRTNWQRPIEYPNDGGVV